MIKRNFKDRTKETILPLYKSLVRPHLDYCSQIWNPHCVKDIKLIEGVQRRATKLVESVKDLHYDERLNILGLMRLDKRRDRSDLIKTFKILNENYKVDKDLFFVPDDGGRRGHSKKLFKRRCRLDIKKFAFSNRIVDNWNSLSENCVGCTTLNNFKSNIRLHWDWKPDSIL